MQNEWNDAEDYHNLSGYESNAGNANYCNDNSQPEIFHSEDYFSHHDGSEASNIAESAVGHEPGNRANFLQSNDDNFDSDSDSTDMGIFNLNKCKKSNEPIRPGDVIEYWNPIFVKGSAQGKRTATVLSVDPSNDNDCSLRLSNIEVIPDTLEIRRVKTMSYRKRKDEDNRIKRKRNSDPRSESEELEMDIAPGPGQIDHPGVTRLISDFALQKWKQPKRLEEFMEMETEAKRMGRIMENNRKIMEKKAKKDGFAPMSRTARCWVCYSLETLKNSK